MAVFRSEADLLDALGRVIGRGRAYVHLPGGEHASARVQGTMSLSSWDEQAERPASIRLPDGRHITIEVDADRLGACLPSNRVLRYRAHWPPYQQG